MLPYINFISYSNCDNFYFRVWLSLEKTFIMIEYLEMELGYEIVWARRMDCELLKI